LTKAPFPTWIWGFFILMCDEIETNLSVLMLSL
jgi:hypothetical protein